MPRGSIYKLPSSLLKFRHKGAACGIFAYENQKCCSSHLSIVQMVVGVGVSVRVRISNVTGPSWGVCT
jgi:hypothetical protein